MIGNKNQLSTENYWREYCSQSSVMYLNVAQLVQNFTQIISFDLIFNLKIRKLDLHIGSIADRKRLIAAHTF